MSSHNGAWLHKIRSRVEVVTRKIHRPPQRGCCESRCAAKEFPSGKVPDSQSKTAFAKNPEYHIAMAPGRSRHSIHRENAVTHMRYGDSDADMSVRFL